MGSISQHLWPREAVCPACYRKWIFWEIRATGDEQADRHPRSQRGGRKGLQGRYDLRATFNLSGGRLLSCEAVCLLFCYVLSLIPENKIVAMGEV